MNCPTCDSSAPHLHPAVQHEGEVQPCRDPFHLTVTPQNTPERIVETQALIDRVYPIDRAVALHREVDEAVARAGPLPCEMTEAAGETNIRAALLAAKAEYPGSRWNDEEHDPILGLDALKRAEYERGFLDGLAAYAYSSGEAWAEPGVQYVGTTGRTLKQAKEQVRDTWNYAP